MKELHKYIGSSFDRATQLTASSGAMRSLCGRYAVNLTDICLGGKESEDPVLYNRIFSATDPFTAA
jgi:hypothetical protein